jgi:RNA polymerase sigma-70 factor (ECF subfamily)
METARGADFREQLDAGDLRGAGDWLVRQHATDVFNLCAAMVRDHAAAEDLTQEVFGKAFSGLSSFRGEASPRTWLLAIARNRCVDHLRRRQRTPWTVEAVVDGDGANAVVDDTPPPPELLRQRGEVARALAILDESQRALIILRFRHGLDYEELSVVFGINAGAARMRVSRALARMRAALAGAEGAAAAPAPRAAVPSAPAAAAAVKDPFAAALGVAMRPLPQKLKSRLAGLLRRLG